MKRCISGVDFIFVILVAGLVLGCATAPCPPGIGGLDNLSLLYEGRGMRASSSDPNWRNGNGDARPIPPGATLVIADLEGPGIIRHIWNTIAAQEIGYSRLVVVRMYWDGESEPSVQCPLGDFFGVGHGVDTPMDSLPICVTSEGRARNCYWPMPFRKSAKITVTNEGRKRINALYWYVDWTKVPKLPRNAGYFHAVYRQEHPTIMGRNYLIGDIEGRGHYVGTLLNVRQHTASWWGEGDDFFFIDGETEPSLRGTGSEDYLCDAWGLRKLSGLFYGVPVIGNYEPYARTTAYRWHICDPVAFNKSLRVEIEHKGVTFNENGEVRSGFEEREDDFSSVAFWYQTEPHKPFAPLPPAYDRLYFDPGNIVEAEALLDKAQVTSGPITKQEGGWSGGGQLFWTPSEPHQALTVPFDVTAAGVYDILFLVTHSYDYGIFDVELDGKPINQTWDLYNQSVVTKEHVVPGLSLTAGSHTLAFRNKGKNASSTGFFFGLDGMVVQPVSSR